MKLSKLFMIALLAGTLGVIGCNDDTTGTGNTNGNGTGGTPSNGSVCDECENQSEIPGCEICFDECADTNPNTEGCVVVALACCEVV